MSEIKFNLIDSQQLVSGTFHAAIGDRCVAALSAEPETIAELELALTRFQKEPLLFTAVPNFVSQPPDIRELDYKPWDAGILIIDLAARIIACDSTYSLPGPLGEVQYHNGSHATDLQIHCQLPDDWLFLRSVDEYQLVREGQREEREANPPLDAREVLYGPALLAFILHNVREACACIRLSSRTTEPKGCADDDCDPLSASVTDIHARWLMTERADLRGQSPREVILSKHDLVNFDLQSRAMQWSFQLVGPPCIPRDSHAYKFAGFGTHEWVLYYDLVRYLIWSAFSMVSGRGNETAYGVETQTTNSIADVSSEPNLTKDPLFDYLDLLRTTWLNEPNDELEGRIPLMLIDNERRRLPEAMGGRSMVIDEDCPCCKMMGDESEAGLGVWFFHLDGSGMDDAFPFSTHETMKEWEEEQRRREEFHREFERKWKDREERLVRGEPIEPDPFFDPVSPEDFLALARAEPEIPEA